MPRPRKPTPSYLKHPTSDRARAVWTDRHGVRHFRLLPGRFRSKESTDAFGRLVLELEVAPEQAAAKPGEPLSVNELLVAYLEFAGRHYRRADGTATSKVGELKAIARRLRELYGDTPAAGFGPLALKAVRQSWVADGHCRRGVNDRAAAVKRVWKWAAGEELVPPAAFHGLQAVPGLRAGRTAAKDRPPVGAADPAAVEATLARLSRHAAGLVRLMRLTGCRPGEACRLTRAQVDAAADPWVYRPAHHKTLHRGKTRSVPLGPRARAVLAEFPTTGPDDPVFSPKAAQAERYAALREARRSKVPPSQKDRRKRRPLRSPGAAFTPGGLAHAVAAAAEKAGVARWKPNQLRHLYATEVRKRYGLEAAQVLLGHAKADVTQVYAERDAGLAARVAAEIG